MVEDEQAGTVDGETSEEIGEGETPGAGESEAASGEKSGTFLVTAADEGSAVLSDVADGQVHPLGTNPGFEAGEVVEATLAPEGPLGVTWLPIEVRERWTPSIEAVDEAPGELARELAGDDETGRLSRTLIDGGELHVVTVDAERTVDAVADVIRDETTTRIAARIGARRVEVRGEGGVVGVRYLTSE